MFLFHLNLSSPEGSSKIVNQPRPITPAGLNQKSVSPKLNNNQLNGSTRSPPTIVNSSNSTTHNSNSLNGSASSHRSPKDKLGQNAQPLNSMPIFNSTTLTGTASNVATGTSSLTKNTFNDYNIGVLSSSSSSSSSSDDDSTSSSSSASSSEDEDDKPQQQQQQKAQQPNSNNTALPNNKRMNISASSSENEMDSDDDEKLSSLNNNLINSLNNGLSNVGISNGPIGFSMPKLSDLSKFLDVEWMTDSPANTNLLFQMMIYSLANPEVTVIRMSSMILVLIHHRSLMCLACSIRNVI